MERAGPGEAITTSWRRWLLPAVTVGVFGATALLLHHELARFGLGSVLRHLGAIPAQALAWAALCTAASYWLLGFYDVLALRYLGKRVSYGLTAFTSFVANAFGHNFGVSPFTGGAVRYRLYSAVGLGAVDVATVAVFCGVSSGLGLAALAGVSFLIDPHQGTHALHMNYHLVTAIGVLLLALVVAYALWSFLGPRELELRGWVLRAPAPAVALPQIALAVLDMGLSAIVLWVLMPGGAGVSALGFAGAYMTATTASLLSHVPAGLGVFETLMLLTFSRVPADQLIGSLLAWRVVYYLLPLLVATLMFGAQELRAQRVAFLRLGQMAAEVIEPVVAPVLAALVFAAGVVLLLSGAIPPIGGRLALLRHIEPLVLLELAQVAASGIGVALLLLARALHRRVAAAYPLAVLLLAAGMLASLLRGLQIVQVLMISVVLAVLWLGRGAFDRAVPVRAQRLSPAWIAGIVVVIVATLWLGLFSFRHASYSEAMWWTFAFHAAAPRMLRTMVLVVVLAAGLITANQLQPEWLEPGAASAEDLARARAIAARSASALANAVLAGDKRVLFSAPGDAFLMFQVSGRSWIALGDPVGGPTGQGELMWRFRDLADRHAGRIVLYEVGPGRLPFYIDLGLTALQLGEQARVSLTDFSLDDAVRAPLRAQHARAERDGAVFEVVPPEGVPALLPKLRAISEAWLQERAVGEKRFSAGSFSEQYVSQLPAALVRRDGEPVGFATLWVSGTGEEIAADLMRFGPDAPRSAMDYLLVELMRWGRAQGHRWFNLGLAPLAGIERGALAPVWHRAGCFVFRHGEHFFSMEALRRYKAQFAPHWEPSYLASPAAVELPRVLLDVFALIYGGREELAAR